MQLALFQEQFSDIVHEEDVVETFEQKDYRIKTMEATAEFLKAYLDETKIGPFQVAYSGGKDSTVTTAIVLKSLLMLPSERRTRKVYITTAQTKLDLTTDPTKQNELNRIQRLIDKNNLPIEIAEVQAPPRESFLFLVLGKGYTLPRPDSKERWCTHKLKITPAERFKAQKNIDYTLVGVRSSESNKRGKSIQKLQVSKYYGERIVRKSGRKIVVQKTIMPIVEFNVSDVWTYLAEQKTPWGDAEEVSRLYKDATGECGLSRRKAGKDETGDACGARFGCIICPLVKIDRSTREISKKKPWFEPYADIRDIMIEMYNDPKNRAGYRRDGEKIGWGKGCFTVKARMSLLQKFLIAQEENKKIASLFGVSPQPLLDQQMLDMIYQQWRKDLMNSPYLEDHEKLGLFYDELTKGRNDGFQLAWNIMF